MNLTAIILPMKPPHPESYGGTAEAPHSTHSKASNQAETVERSSNALYHAAQHQTIDNNEGMARTYLSVFPFFVQVHCNIQTVRHSCDSSDR